MKIYIDSDFRCHLENLGDLRQVDEPFFDGKCRTFIEGFRLVPSGAQWTRDDGIIFQGYMISAAEDYDVLCQAQAQYENDFREKFASLGIPVESDFIATRNYELDSFLGIHAQLYKVVSAIPTGASITEWQNVVKTTTEAYLETLKDG